MLFWSIAAGLSGLILLTLLAALLRRGKTDGSAASDVGVYRDQLKEVDRDLARGVITEDEAEQIRLEVSRRLLDADRASQADQAGNSAPKPATVAAAALVAATVIGGALLVYARIGAPGYPDLPIERRIALAEQARLNRPSQITAEAQIPPAPSAVPQEMQDLIARLRIVVRERPDELHGQELLAQNEARLGNFSAAHAALAEVIRIKGDQATAEDHANLADMMVIAAGGYVSPEAETALGRALELDPSNGTARYYLGLTALQTGRPDMAFRIWRALLEASPADAPWGPPIRAQIEGVARLAGVDYALANATPTRGPSQADIDAAAEMSPAERLEMIEGMVAGLSDRLATEGGPPSDWARLIRALGVLGRRGEAAAIWAEAQEVFPDDITRVEILQAARDAGVAQ